jgi:hypothetical protein
VKAPTAPALFKAYNNKLAAKPPRPISKTIFQNRFFEEYFPEIGK